VIVAKKTAFALVKRNCLLSPIDNSVRNLAMQGTENVTSPKQVYKLPEADRRNHHSTDTWESARHWADCRQALPNRVTSELPVIREGRLLASGGSREPWLGS
jgi:hypothetical protein